MTVIIFLALAAMGAPGGAALAAFRTAPSTYRPKIDELGVPQWNPTKEDYLAYNQRLIGRPERIACGPDPLYRDDELDVVMPRSHGAAMLIFDAKGRFYDIDDIPIWIDPHGDARRGRPNSQIGNIVSDISKDINEFSAKVEDIRKRPQVNSPHLFSASGTYGIVVGPEIETEDPIVDGWCVIHYIDRPRRPQPKASAKPR